MSAPPIFPDISLATLDAMLPNIDLVVESEEPYTCIYNYIVNSPSVYQLTQAKTIQTYLKTNGITAIVTAYSKAGAFEFTHKIVVVWNQEVKLLDIGIDEIGPGVLSELTTTVITASLLLDPSAQAALTSFLASLGATFTSKALTCTVVLDDFYHAELSNLPGVIKVRAVKGPV